VRRLAGQIDELPVDAQRPAQEVDVVLGHAQRLALAQPCAGT
jgi:hypothetical protein